METLARSGGRFKFTSPGSVRNKKAPSAVPIALRVWQCTRSCSRSHTIYATAGLTGNCLSEYRDVVSMQMAFFCVQSRCVMQVATGRTYVRTPDQQVLFSLNAHWQWDVSEAVTSQFAMDGCVIRVTGLEEDVCIRQVGCTRKCIPNSILRNFRT